ncbi:hypothetical protein FACS1894120_2650 [Clostridia bacterium]|nr:hypothetical protein FACS1894120_2650 [Clostridia bacterium]
MANSIAREGINTLGKIPFAVYTAAYFKLLSDFAIYAIKSAKTTQTSRKIAQNSLTTER